MNINDIPIENLLETCYEIYEVDGPIAVIFARQRELIEKYLPIEEEILRRPLPELPFDLHDAVCQEALKARAWWFVEEMGEAFDALNEQSLSKFREELSDALHFLTELLILSGFEWEEINTELVPKDWIGKTAPVVGFYRSNVLLKVRALAVIGELAMAMWHLRNKPWKRTQVLTDVDHYHQRLRVTYSGFLNLLMAHCDLTLEDVAILYLRKSEVNKFRMRSNY